MTNMDKLYEAVEARGPVCVGLDTDFSYLPADFVDSTLTKGENIVRFNKKLIDATKAVAGCYKVQIAYYESLGLEGMKAYADTLKAVREAGVPVIADIKRGDIAKTAEMYAMGHFTGDFESDFVTLAPYMGLDSISPYLPYAEKQGKGMFVLCRTSNGGAKDFEYEKLADGRHVYDLVGDKLNALGKDYMGEHGYSSIGLVIGGTHIEEATEIRAKYQDSFFLIPGYGAQGGKAADIAQYLTKGSLVFVEGSLQTRKWQDQQGQDRYTTEIKAQRVQFLDKRGGEQGGMPSGAGGSEGGYSAPRRPAAQQGGGSRPQQRPQQRQDDYEDLGPAFPSEASGMDDVPF